MTRRHSIYVKGFSHKNPIPAAARIENLVMSGLVNGVDPETGEFPETLEAQCECLFQQVRLIVEAAGGSLDDIIKMTVLMKDAGDRSALNKVWLATFPDAANRPARQTSQAALEAPRLVQCDFTAIVDGPIPAASVLAR